MQPKIFGFTKAVVSGLILVILLSRVLKVLKGIKVSRV